MNFEAVIPYIQGVLLLLLVLQAAVTDLSKRRIYNLPTLIALIAGLVIGYLRGGWGEFSLAPESLLQLSFINSLAGAWVMFFLFFIAYIAGGMGAGDAKLVAGVGALGGLSFSLWSLMHIALAGIPLAIICLILKGDVVGGMRRAIRGMLRLKWRKTDTEQMGEPVTIPYAVAICLGVIWTMYFLFERSELSLF